ncbi:MAG TPA: hypothetical protein VGG83_14925 [Trebonia sp.]
MARLAANGIGRGAIGCLGLQLTLDDEQLLPPFGAHLRVLRIDVDQGVC